MLLNGLLNHVRNTVLVHGHNITYRGGMYYTWGYFTADRGFHGALYGGDSFIGFRPIMYII